MLTRKLREAINKAYLYASTAPLKNTWEQERKFEEWLKDRELKEENGDIYIGKSVAR